MLSDQNSIFFEHVKLKFLSFFGVVIFISDAPFLHTFNILIDCKSYNDRYRSLLKVLSWATNVVMLDRSPLRYYFLEESNRFLN